MKKVVILGGGFGGIYTLLHLKKCIQQGTIEVTLVSRDDRFLFTPLLHEVVSGKVRDTSVGFLISDLCREENISFCKTEVLSVDVSLKCVQTDFGNIFYDMLVLALGASVHFFGVPGAESLLRFKTLSDANIMKEKVYALVDDPQRGVARIAIIGAGATGVELAAEVADIVNASGRRGSASACCPARSGIEILLLEATEDILPHTNTRLRDMARNSLQKRGVHIRTNAAVQNVAGSSLYLHTGERIAFDLGIWSSGVRAFDLSLAPAQATTAAYRLEVLPTLQLERAPFIFALGEIADGYPMTAQVAVAQAKVVAHNIGALIREEPLRIFTYQPAGMFFSLGRWMAGAEVKVHLLHKTLSLWGVAAWWLWHAVCLMKVPGWKNKWNIGRDWLRGTEKPEP